VTEKYLIDLLEQISEKKSETKITVLSLFLLNSLEKNHFRFKEEAMEVWMMTFKEKRLVLN